MKHIKSINEYQRTAGFRYSNPNIDLRILCYYIGNANEQNVKKALENIYNLTFDNITVDNNSGKILNPEGNVISVDGSINFNISVYNEKEIDKITEDFIRIMDSQFDVATTNFIVKDKKVL